MELNAALKAKGGSMTASRPWYETVALDSEQERKVAALQGAVADLLAVRSGRRRRPLQWARLCPRSLPDTNRYEVLREVCALVLATECNHFTAVFKREVLPAYGPCRTRLRTAPSAPEALTSATSGLAHGACLERQRWEAQSGVLAGTEQGLCRVRVD